MTRRTPLGRQLALAAWLAAAPAWLAGAAGCSDGSNAPGKQAPRERDALTPKKAAEAEGGSPFGLSIPLGKLPVTLELSTNWEITVTYSKSFGDLGVRVPVLRFTVDGKTFKWLPEEPGLRLRLNDYLGRTWTAKGGHSWELGADLKGARGFLVGVSADGPKALDLLASKAEFTAGKLTLTPLVKDWHASKLTLELLQKPGPDFRLSGPLLQQSTPSAKQIEARFQAILDAHKSINAGKAKAPTNPK